MAAPCELSEVFTGAFLPTDLKIVFRIPLYLGSSRVADLNQPVVISCARGCDNTVFHEHVF